MCTCLEGYTHENGNPKNNICIPVTQNDFISGNTYIWVGICELEGSEKEDNTTEGNKCISMCFVNCTHRDCAEVYICTFLDGYSRHGESDNSICGSVCSDVCTHENSVDPDACECLFVCLFVCLFILHFVDPYIDGYIMN